MFLANLTDVQKKAFLAIALRIINADRSLDPKERKMVEAMRYEMGMWQETDLPSGSLEYLAGFFDTRESQIILLLEGVALAYADGKFVSSEKEVLRALARIFGIPEEEATRAENLVLQYRKFTAEALSLMKGESTTAL